MSLEETMLTAANLREEKNHVSQQKNKKNLTSSTQHVQGILPSENDKQSDGEEEEEQ